MNTVGLGAKKFVFGSVCVFGVALFLLKLHTLRNMHVHISTSIGSSKLNDMGESGVFNDVYQKRVETIKQVCIERDIQTGNYSKPSLLYSDKHRIASLVVPKAGSTSAVMIFRILNDMASEKDFKASRSSMHGSKVNKKIKKHFDLESLLDYTILIPARDPYSRLFSAFIDKVHLADNVKLVQDVLKRSIKHGNIEQWWRYDVTFQMILNYAFDQTVSSHTLASHFKPLFKEKVYTWLCSLSNYIVIKQESFSQDYEYALNVVKAGTNKMKKVKDVLHSRRVDTTVIGVIKTEMKKMNGRFHSMGQFKNATNRYDASVHLLGRIWKTFQIQGYINVRSDFPHEKFSSERFVLDGNYIEKVILQEIKRDPLTPKESKRQRHEAMLTAYGNIKEDTIRMIQTMYELDFEAFGYNRTLPS